MMIDFILFLVLKNVNNVDDSFVLEWVCCFNYFDCFDFIILGIYVLVISSEIYLILILIFVFVY